MIFYTKDGEEFKEATEDQLLHRFKERIGRIKSNTEEEVKTKLSNTLKDELTPKITEDLTKSLTEDLTKTLSQKIEGEYKTKLEDAEKKASEKETVIRQKTIAAEYGFKSDMENFLGTGTDEEMRANADKLKSNVVSSTGPKPNKETGNGKQTSGLVSKVS